MKAILLASAVAIGVVGLSSSSFALGSKFNMPVEFGEVVEMDHGGHMMHLQMIQDKTGGKWVVMSMEDAEMVLGSPLGKYKFTVLP